MSLKTPGRWAVIGVVLLAATPYPGRLAAQAPAVSRSAPATSVPAQNHITSPVEFFGHEIGADYVLPDYKQLTAYWQKLASESDRMKLVAMGQTAEGRTQYMAIITSAANQANLDRYQQISSRLAHARLTDDQARALARTGKAVVWIDGGLHATEVLGAEQLMETVYELVSRNDPETTRILNDVVVLAVHCNPDGMDLVSDWYMRQADPHERSTSGIPVLYQKYVGHDDNRDFYANTQPETRNMDRVLFHEWFPQIVYNHHQTGPTGAVMFSPPFRDPFNYVFDPLLITELDQVGDAMHSRFMAEGKGGVTWRTGANYSTWWNGGLRTVVYFHNMIGLLTETIGNPTPIQVPFVPDMQLPHNDLPLPVTPGLWHFRRSVDYMLTANYAVLDFAQRYRESLLYNQYRMGADEIAFGSEDHWTAYPSRIDSVRKELEATRSGAARNREPARGGLFGNAPDSAQSAGLLASLHRPEWRDARGYIIPSDQPDFPTAVKFVDALLWSGIDVLQATSPFTVAGKRYPAGSLVIKTAQAFRPHILDMFEPQDHPNDFRYPGGPPVPPYDNAGWTLAYQMGVHFDRILDAFDGPFRPVNEYEAPVPPGTVGSVAKPAGYLISTRVNDAFHAANVLMAQGATVYRLSREWSSGGHSYAPGTFYVPARSNAAAALQKLAHDLGLDVQATSSKPSGRQYRLHAPRIGLWDRYGGSQPSGWTRWIMEQFGFPYHRIYAKELDAGNLRRRYDVLIFVDGAIPARDAGGRRSFFFDNAPDSATIPRQYWPTLGRVTVEHTVPQLRAFLQDGGTIVTIGSSTALARHLDLPVGDKLVRNDSAGRERPLTREEYYIPGSILHVRMNDSLPVAFGMTDSADVFFDNSPVFALGPDAAAAGLRPIAWFDSPHPLRSGWAWGQQFLDGGTAMARASVGKGTLYLFGPEILFRGQPHGTFKLLFNAVDQSAARLENVH